MRAPSLLVLFSLVVLRAVPVEAVSNLTLSPGVGTSYILSGQGVEGAAAFECTVTYDAAVLGNPNVELGALAAGGMMAVNPNTPGTIRIAVIRTNPMTGSGPIMTVAFDRKNDASGRVNVLTAKMISSDGKPLQVSVSVLPDTQPPVSTAQSVPSSDASPRQAGTQATTSTAQQPVLLPLAGGGVVPLKQDDERQRKESGAGRQEQPPIPDKPIAAADPSRLSKLTDDVSTSSASRRIYSQKSVLERFREFRGQPTVAGYLALFDQEGMIGFRQDPPVALADGRTTVGVTFISSSPTRTSSDIAVMGATLVSLKKDPDYTNTFVIELMPAKGVIQANISVPQGSVLMVFPLTVAPGVEIDLFRGGKADEGAFRTFLAERGSAEKPKYDLNGDGRRDYIDDYLFTVNYLAARQRAVAQKAGK